MQVVQNSSDPLTYGEYRKRLLEKFEKNPNDPELQDLKKSLEGSFKNLIQDTAQNLRRFIDSPLFQNTLKSIPPPSTLISTNLIPSQIQKELTYLSPPGDYKHQILMNRLYYIEDLIVEEKLVDSEHGEKGLDLLSLISEKNNRYKVHRKIAELFLNTLKVDNFHIFQRIKATYLSYSRKRLKVTRGYYESDRKKNNTKIQNVFRYLKSIAKGLGYTFKIRSDNTELVKI